jgi:tRNA(adenine34) deaminase
MLSALWKFAVMQAWLLPMHVEQHPKSFKLSAFSFKLFLLALRPLMELYTDEYFMREALKEANKALEIGEVPVGAVVACRNRIIARAHNQTEKLTDATAHAEMLAITAASNHLGSKYLNECVLYVTLEPCVMCAGALHWVQLQKLVFGASDLQRGFSLVNSPLLHPRTEVVKGVKAPECKQLIDGFFREIRK